MNTVSPPAAAAADAALDAAVRAAAKSVRDDLDRAERQHRAALLRLGVLADLAEQHRARSPELATTLTDLENASGLPADEIVRLATQARVDHAEWGYHMRKLPDHRIAELSRVYETAQEELHDRFPALGGLYAAITNLNASVIPEGFDPFGDWPEPHPASAALEALYQDAVAGIQRGPLGDMTPAWYTPAPPPATADAPAVVMVREEMDPAALAALAASTDSVIWPIDIPERALTFPRYDEVANRVRELADRAQASLTREALAYVAAAPEEVRRLVVIVAESGTVGITKDALAARLGVDRRQMHDWLGAAAQAKVVGWIRNPHDPEADDLVLMRDIVLAHLRQRSLAAQQPSARVPGKSNLMGAIIRDALAHTDAPTTDPLSKEQS